MTDREDPGTAAPDAEVAEALRLDRRRRPWLRRGGVVALLVLGGVLLFSWVGLGPEEPAYETEAVRRAPLEVTVTAVGTLEPLNTVEVGSEQSGLVASVEVEVNDRVEVDQTLATLDTAVLSSQAAEASAAVSAARAALEQAEVEATAADRERERTARLHAQGDIADAELDQVRDAAERASAAVEASRAALRQAQAAAQASGTLLEQSVIRSPIDGVVLERRVDPGQAVVSALQASTLFVLAEDLAQMRVLVEVDEADVGRVEAGQAATFTVAAWPDRVFRAEVVKVHLAPMAEAQVITYAAELHLDNPDLVLRPGMTATATVTTEAVEGLLVPNAALRYAPPEEAELPPLVPRDGRMARRVWVLEDGEPVPVEVLPGASDGQHTVVEGDLAPEDAVILRARTS